MSNDRKIVVLSTKYNPARKLGEFSSDEYNRLNQSIVNDLGDLVNASNSIYNELLSVVNRLKYETLFLKKRIKDMESDIEYRRESLAKNGDVIEDWIDFHDTSNLFFPESQPENLKALINSTFGEVTLPILTIDNKFVIQSITTGKVLPNYDLVIDTTSIFNKNDGNGLLDYEYGGFLIEKDPENAFNGVNNSIWERRVEFALDSDVSEVECEITITVPEQNSLDANCVSFNPYPYGEIDITNVAIATSLNGSFATIDQFTATNNAGYIRVHFPVQPVHQLKIRLRQRNWIEEENKKVFIYGMEEIGLALIEWQKSYTPNGNIDENTTFIVKFTSPDGYNFSRLTSINFNPDFSIENLTNRHIHVVLSQTPDFAGAIWNSDISVLPQDLTNGVSIAGLNELYCIVTLNYVESIGNNGSPFTLNTTPFLYGIGIQYTTEVE